MTPIPSSRRKISISWCSALYDMKISHVFLCRPFPTRKATATSSRSISPTAGCRCAPTCLTSSPWQLQTRGGVKVYAWMPVLAFDLSSDLPRVQRWDPQTGKALLARQPYVRLSPRGSPARQQITDIYEDLARHASFSGILFHDDAVLTDFEDVSPEWSPPPGGRRVWGNDAGPVPQRPQERQRRMRFKKPNPDPLHSGSTPGGAGHPRPAGENGA